MDTPSGTTPEELLPTCICGAAGGAEDVINGIPVRWCGHCGVVRQRLRMTLDELATWYRDEYHKSAYYHSYEQDLDVAEKRLAAYKFPEGAKILDVGCGNAAFVHRAREKGYDAWGQELAETADGPHVYVGALEDIAFPTDSFDAVTLHDVLEHHPVPGPFLQECVRILKPGGELIVDFPRFDSEEHGKHHWKKVEHLWMLNEIQLRGLLARSGCSVSFGHYPIPSKVVLVAKKQEVVRPSILVPSGIGDTYWVITKLPGFLKKMGLGLPDVWVQDSGKALKRAEPFLQTIPFVHAAGYKDCKPNDPVFLEAYFRAERTVFPKTFGVDYFMAYNGVMRFGANLEEVDPDFGCDWFPKMHISKEASDFQAQLEADGPYVVGYFIGHGMYGKWMAEFSNAQLQETLRAISAKLGLRVVMIGAKWDVGSLGDQMAAENPTWLNFIGKTTYDRLLGTLRGASLVYGYPSGASILGPVLKRPTVMLWQQSFQKEFWVNSVPPRMPYRALDTKDLTVQTVVDAAAEVMGDQA